MDPSQSVVTARKLVCLKQKYLGCSQNYSCNLPLKWPYHHLLLWNQSTREDSLL
ncbi:hypothetical protein DPMN_147167 [Dreissena polymorpha]|uniref:Uncharacterized protein n=1 Tax=Dreissena polymorpha TaxID=45954 RepID=A0A9D4F9C7_DREPO|nr:hypothetical protein DPMN_147167 [Dreissena polymorpha]